MLLASAKKLRSFGIIGMNQRNFGLISRYNPRHLYPLVDDKLKTKLLAQKAGITVPKLLGTVEYQHDVKLLKEILQPHAQFVIKPVKGSGGKGILVITEHDHNLYFKPSGDSIQLADIERRTIIDALINSHGRVYGAHGAAASLGVKPTTLYAKMRKHSISKHPTSNDGSSQ